MDILNGELQVGVEIEVQCQMPLDVFQRRYCNRDGMWVSPMAKLYMVHYDGSLHLKDQDGLEVSSPILGEADLPDLKALIGFLKKTGCYTTNLCGLHVHLDRYRDGKEVNLVKLKEVFDAEMEKIKNSSPSGHYLMPYPNRRDGKYSGRWTQKAYCELKFDRIDSGYRYQAIAATPKTCEFRLFNGCLDFRYVLKCLQFCCRLMASCR